jgi:hypothetical protein
MQKCVSTSGVHSFVEGKETVLKISRNIVRTVTFSSISQSSTKFGASWNGVSLGFDQNKYKENVKKLTESIPEGLDNSIEFKFTERYCTLCGQAISVLDKLLFGLLGLGLDKNRIEDFMLETDNFQRFLTN